MAIYIHSFNYKKKKDIFLSIYTMDTASIFKKKKNLKLENFCIIISLFLEGTLLFSVICLLVNIHIFISQKRFRYSIKKKNLILTLKGQ